MRTIKAHRLDNAGMTEYETRCTRCGIAMKANNRARTQGVTPLCTDCRETDKGLALLWRKRNV